MEIERLQKRIDELELLVAERRKENVLNNIQGDVCIRPPVGGKLSEQVTVVTFKSTTLTDKRRQIEDFCRDLVINNDHISRMEQSLRKEIEKGLASSTHPTASVKCFPTYVEELPSGDEVGKFLALDLGGTNFRVVLMNITGSQSEMESEIFAVPVSIMKGPGEELFDHIAQCLASFMKARDIKATLPLGFTFSFPCKQYGLARGELIAWTKGFSCSGVEGRDVVQLLQEAILRRDDVKIDVAAILNDTTGCLMSCAWKNPKCRIGLIIGTGLNACYLEDEHNVQTLDSSHRGRGKHMIINTEWGAFGNNGELDFIFTRWDAEVDKGSINPGKQIFEKMVSGMYMGEVVRQVVVDLQHNGLIFQEEGESLKKPGAFLTKYVSDVESDPVGDYTRCKTALGELGITNPSTEDCSALRYVCECVSRRAGFLVSAGITALLKKMNYHDVVVAVDGSVFRFHPHFQNIMRSRIAQLMGTDYKFDLMLSTDGSGRGAALVAAVLHGECPI